MSAATACVTFPSNPNVGDIFNVNNLQYIWDGEKWITRPSPGTGGGGDAGDGTVTDVTAGIGLSGGTITRSGVIALQTPVTIANGGTGATNLASAQANLGITPGGTPGGGTVTSVTATPPLTGGTITSAGSIGMPNPLPVINGGTGAITLAGAQANLGIVVGGGGTSTGTVPFGWPNTYADPVGYTGRVIQPGQDTYVNIASGAYPVQYRVSDGVTAGGIFPTGISNGSLPIRIETIHGGTGVLKWVTVAYMTIVNNGNVAGSFKWGIGTTASIAGGKPMYPYLGVNHDVGSQTMDIAPLTILPGTSIQVFQMRMDVVDNALESDQPIANWPNWTASVAAPPSLLYPALCPTIINNGAVPLTVMDVVSFGFAC